MAKKSEKLTADDIKEFLMTQSYEDATDLIWELHKKRAAIYHATCEGKPVSEEFKQEIRDKLGLPVEWSTEVSDHVGWIQKAHFSSFTITRSDGTWRRFIDYTIEADHDGRTQFISDRTLDAALKRATSFYNDRLENLNKTIAPVKVIVDEFNGRLKK